MHLTDSIAPEQLLAHNLDKTPFALIAWNPDVKVSSWSQQAQALFGWNEEEVIGKYLFDIHLVYEEDLPAVNKVVKELVTGTMDRYTASNRNVRKDGTVVTCIWYCFVVRDADGGVLNYLSLVQDVTEKAQQDAVLKRANERLSLLTNATNDGIWEWEVEQNKVWANESFRKTYGYDPRDYPDFYNEWLSRMHPDDKESFLKSTAAARERQEPAWSGEFRFRLANGSYGTILQKVHFMYDTDGHLFKAVGVDIDVTHLRQTEAALRLSEEKFSRAFRSSPVPLNILRLHDLTFTDVNDAYCRLVGFTREELIGKPYQEFNIITDRSVREAVGILQQQGSINNHKVEMLRKDGSALYCLISADILLIEGEKYLLTTLFDITEQVKAEAALRLNEQQLELVYNTIGDVLFLIEIREGVPYRFITVNEAFLTGTGLAREQVQGRTVQEVIPPPALLLALVKFQEAVATRGMVQWEQASPFGDGSRTGIISITPVFDDRGDCIRLVGTVYDITIQKKAAEELSRSYQEIRLLASHLQDVREEERASIAREIHDELGQLLTALKMEVSWLRRIDTLAPAQVARRVGSVNTLLDGAINTVRNISAELRPSILDDLGLVEALSWQSREFEKRFGIPLQFSTNTPEMKLPREVATALFRIFQEALTNIARHAGAHQVKAVLNLLPGYLSLEVTDDGIGFEQEKIAAQKTLGLMGIKERIAAINGHFHLQTAPGQGTVITVRAPYTPPEM